MSTHPDTARAGGLAAEAPRPGETELMSELKPSFERFQTVV